MMMAKKESAVDLVSLKAGETAEVIHFRPERGETAANTELRAEQLGFRLGKRVTMIRNAGKGPLLLRVDEARIALARSLAFRILVRREVP